MSMSTIVCRGFITSGDQNGIWPGLFMNLPDDAGSFSAVRLLQSHSQPMSA